MIINGSHLSIMLNNKMKRNQNNIQQSMGKLSSGLRIRSASDDAAGLSISQRMKALARGTHQAIRNVQDAASLVAVADGAMEEMTNVIQRIRELTIQSTNGSNTDVDRLMIQNEIDHLKGNLSEIVHNTEFNTKKILTNKEAGEYIYEDRSASKTILLSESSDPINIVSQMNQVYSANLNLESNRNVYQGSVDQEKLSSTTTTYSYIGTTVSDHLPRWSQDGTQIIFDSSRNTANQYVVPADGTADPVVKDSSVTVAGQQLLSENGLMRLQLYGSTLYLERRSSLTDSWTSLQSFSDYNYSKDLSGGFSFSSKVDSGITSFVYSDTNGNIRKVDVNQDSRIVLGSSNVIPTTDELNLPPINNTLSLTSQPNLYRMNQVDASLRVEKVTDSGARTLTYWDGTGIVPTGGYYMVSGSDITFYDEAIIGNEANDDAQDYYRFSYVSDGTQDKVYSTNIPTGAEIYNMHGESGPRSLNIRVGGTTVSQTQLLSSPPAASEIDTTNGVYVDEASGKIYFYGSLRPAFNENVTIEYMNDVFGRNGVQTFDTAFPNIDTYNLDNPDPTANRSLRVYVGGTEVNYDDTKTNGYWYDPSNGRIHLYGDARPNMPDSPTIKVEYFSDYSGLNTSSEVYGIPLYSYPEVYNPGSTTSSSSIRVYQNGTTEIPYSSTDGFQYNSSTNTIELYGTSRPNVGSTNYYRVDYIAATGTRSDGVVEVNVSSLAEDYGITDPSIPSTFKVFVDGTEISYDATKTNGYFYNSTTNKIEIYGDARPEAGDSSYPDVRISYVTEVSSLLTNNDTYDFQLDSQTIDYGLTSATGPKSMRVYQNGVEVPYDADNGFTYDAATKRVSLHGSYRPDSNDSAGTFRVYSITADNIQTSIPAGAYVYKVSVNGSEVPEAQDPTGDGYIIKDNQIELIGSYRPDIRNTSSYSITVKYFDSVDIGLDTSGIDGYGTNYCEHEEGAGILSTEVDSTSLVVKVDGNQLTSNQYTLDGNRIRLNRENITLNNGSHNFSVNYRVKHGIGYKPNEFNFQVGANSGDSFKVDIESFDNLLRDTDVICVRNFEDAEKGLKVVDHALEFVSSQRGYIGAVENRLDSIVSNLTVLEETTTASLSRIEDVDMAKEAMNLVKLQILSQAQNAMVSHARQQPEQILQLLK